MERTVGELLSTYAEIFAELRERGVVRSANAPAGDYAEWLCSRALGATLADNFSVKSHDLGDAVLTNRETAALVVLILLVVFVLTRPGRVDLTTSISGVLATLASPAIILVPILLYIMWISAGVLVAARFGAWEPLDSQSLRLASVGWKRRGMLRSQPKSSSTPSTSS
jgi:hypothetical protein